jgi:hypothetical protein
MTAHALEAFQAELLSVGAKVSSDAARSLQLLNAIEATCDWLAMQKGTIEAITTFVENVTPKLLASEKVIDDEDRLEPALLKAQDAAKSLYESLIAKRESARADVQLRPDDGVEDAFTQAISAVADLHNALNQARWQFLEHDADLDEVLEGTACSPEDLKTLLHS